MKYKSGFIFLLLLSVILLLVSATAEGGIGSGVAAKDAYEKGKESFSAEEYVEAAWWFEKAGNHEDAKKWAYYCQAIDLVINGGENDLPRAQARFELLAGQEFEQAVQWVAYCKGRYQENTGMFYAAINKEEG